MLKLFTKFNKLGTKKFYNTGASVHSCENDLLCNLGIFLYLNHPVLLTCVYGGDGGGGGGGKIRNKSRNPHFLGKTPDSRNPGDPGAPPAGAPPSRSSTC